MGPFHEVLFDWIVLEGTRTTLPVPVPPLKIETVVLDEGQYGSRKEHVNDTVHWAIFASAQKTSFVIFLS